MAYFIAEPCIGTKDTACVDACPVDCIHPKKDTQYEDGRPGFEQVDQLFIDPVECIDCGACVPVCPVSAIFALDDLPEKLCFSDIRWSPSSVLRRASSAQPQCRRALVNQLVWPGSRMDGCTGSPAAEV